MVDHTPQHIRRRCGKATFDAVESGEKTFELFVGNDVHLEKDDLVTLEEWDPIEKKYTGRKITRKLSYVLNTKDVGIPGDEINRYGVTICGTLHPDFFSLQSIFNSKYLTGLILQTKEEGSYEILNGPFYLPPLSTPEFYEMGIYDKLHIEKWPIGVFDVVLMVKPDVARDRFIIIDQQVMGCVYTVNEQNQYNIEAVPLSIRALQLGKVRHVVDGKELQLADPEEVNNLMSFEEEVELPTNLTMSDSLTRGTEEQLRSMLEEEGLNPNIFEEEEEEEEGER